MYSPQFGCSVPKQKGVSITKHFYAVFPKCLNIHNQNLLVKSRETLGRTYEQQGCLKLNYLSKKPMSIMRLKTIFYTTSSKEKNNWKLEISWAGVYTNKKVDWFAWLTFDSRYRNFIIEVLNICYHSYPYDLKKDQRQFLHFLSR